MKTPIDVHDAVDCLKRKCLIDGDVPGRVVGVAFFDDGSAQMRVSWWNNGSLHHEWMAVDRVEIQP